jgi:hypothetical protein
MCCRITKQAATPFNTFIHCQSHENEAGHHALQTTVQHHALCIAHATKAAASFLDQTLSRLDNLKHARPEEGALFKLIVAAVEISS